MSEIEILLVHEALFQSYKFFNPNHWTGASKNVIASCAAQYGLLNYLISQMPTILENCDKLCAKRFGELQIHWKNSPWDLENCIYLVENPEFHLYTQTFLQTVKTFLDIIVQLIATQKIVSNQIHGFHKKNKHIGGRLLNSLQYNAIQEKKDVAAKLYELIEKHKTIWIDQAVTVRDNLTHPDLGIQQVMFVLEIDLINDNLRLVQIHRPLVDGKEFGIYAQETFSHIHNFSKHYLQLFQ